jgi:O-antigen/teichoic acid export membrane protein
MGSSAGQRARLSTSAAWNFLGIAGPMVAALWAIPRLVEGLGTERFGLMSIVWALVGYFSLFDLGIGRALTKMVAERWDTPRQGEILELVSGGMRLMWILGIAAGLLIAVLTPWLVSSVLNIPDVLTAEARWSLWILAGTMPFVIAAAGDIGVLQGAHRFDAVTWVRLPLGIGNFLAPVWILTISNSLVAVTAVIAVTRVLAWYGFRIFSTRQVRRLRPSDGHGAVGTWPQLLGFGGWVTVSSIVGPIMVYFDRFLIAGIVGAAAVAYYTTPFEVISRMAILPAAIMGVLFPTFAAYLGQDAVFARQIYHRAMRVVLPLMLAPPLLVTAYSFEALQWWISPEFALQSATVAQWLAVGVFANALAGLPFVALQGQGRPDLTAKLHLVELFIYVPMLYWAISRFGIVGAAVTWSARAAADLLALSWLCARHVEALRSELFASVPVVLGCVFLLMLSPTVAIPWMRLSLVATVVVGSAIMLLWQLRDRLPSSWRMPNAW